MTGPLQQVLADTQSDTELENVLWRPRYGVTSCTYGATTDVNQQKQIIGQLEQVMLTQVPIIPVTESVDWFQYDTTHFTGWPTPQNQYALPSAFQVPDMGQVLLHLQPK